ncbi:MAG: hypothetical protein LC793_03420 [Thermomicrobia bacterium]|nr:hypothetical protein [Thermomicrobia bacterium]
MLFLVRTDGRFQIAQQFTGGSGRQIPIVDWAQSKYILPGPAMTNLLRVEVRAGQFACYVNNQPVRLPQAVPAEVASFSALAFAANVLKESVEPDARAIFSKFRYEKLT